MTASIIVLETSAIRVPALRLELADTDLEIRGASRASELESRCNSSDSHVVVWETSADVGNMLSWLTRRLLADKSPPVIAMGNDFTAELEWTCRGLGVVSWSPTDLPTHELARMCRRLLARKTRLESWQGA